MINKPIQFHWRLIQGGETSGLTRAQQLEGNATAMPDVKAQATYSDLAADLGFESLLVDISYGKPDPLVMSAGIAPFTNKIKFLAAVRSGLITPTYFAQQVNSFSCMYNGRILLNVVAGHSPKEQAYYGDFLPHDERYTRTEEFLAICNALWHNNTPFDYKGKYYSVRQAQLNTPFVSPNRQAPYLFVAGGSKGAIDLAINQGDCWMRLADTPEDVAARATPVLEAGKEVGLRMCTFIRDTKEEAVQAAYQLIGRLNKNGESRKEGKFVSDSDSVSIKEVFDRSEEEWLKPWLWTGAVRTHGSPSVCFVGTPDEIADAIMEYKRAGVTQYILAGWPKRDEMIRFGKKVIPLVREREQAAIHQKSESLVG